MKLRWSYQAERDLYEIGDYIALDDPAAAASWIERLQERARRAARMPSSGRHVPESDDEDVREVFLGTYRIIYRVLRDGILVLAVIEGHQLLRDL